MSALTLEQTRTIINEALAFAHAKNFKPLGIVVVDGRGAVRGSMVEDNNILMRFEIARGKANGAVSMGMGTRSLMKMAADRPAFLAAVSELSHNGLVPVPGGVLIRDEAGHLLGAIGVSGDTSDNDELAAVAGIEAAGLRADPGIG